jgi:trehalose 6-phosphate synthase
MYRPVQYMHRSLDEDKLCALCAISDVCLVSSIQDGLNLVSYEYVACQTERKGVLAILQYTGAAKMLPSSTLINAWDIPRFVKIIRKALTMPMKKRARRQDKAAKMVEHWTRYVVSLCPVHYD